MGSRSKVVYYQSIAGVRRLPIDVAGAATSRGSWSLVGTATAIEFGERLTRRGWLRVECQRIEERIDVGSLDRRNITVFGPR